MMSQDQIDGPYWFDRVGLLAGAYLERRSLSWLELRAGLHVGGFFSWEKSPGGLLDATAGTLLRVPSRKLSPYIAVDFGAGLTGTLVRPYLMLSAGLDARLSEHTNIGPVVGYGQLIQYNGAGLSSDARFIFFGASFRYDFFRQPAPPVPPPPPPVVRRRRVAPPAAEPPPSEPSVDVLELIERALPSPTQRVELLAPVLFAFDSDELEPIGISMLHEVAATLQSRPDVELVQIQGHADQRGNAEYNRALSQRRAERVQSWLVEHGIAQERLEVDAHGAVEPLERDESEPAQQQNRRVVFRVLRLKQGGTP
jgi:outer membrane protein OmpA-like peptidoglycan-associated protein